MSEEAKDFWTAACIIGLAAILIAAVRVWTDWTLYDVLKWLG